MPVALQNKPRLRPWLEPQYRAFQMLSSSRSVGMGGVSAIAFSEIAAYLQFEGICDYEEKTAWVMTIQALDSVYLKHVTEKSRDPEHRAAKDKPVPKPPKRPPRRKRR